MLILRETFLILTVFLLGFPILANESEQSKSGDCLQVISEISPLATENGQMVWDKITEELYSKAFSVCLSEYIQIKTVNPPGGEVEAVNFLKKIFRVLEIPTREWVSEGRSSLLASLLPEKQAPGPSIILYHHSDVVPVFPEQWKKAEDTFSGASHDGYLWGRGSLDMKSTGIAQLLSMAIIKKSNLPITKAIHFIAAADEEVGARGAKSVLKEMEHGGVLADLGSVEVLLNEGGYGINRGSKNFYVVGTEEKGGAWMKVKHPDPMALLRHLNESFVLMEANEGEIENHVFSDCHLDQFYTLGAQINVNPSKAQLHLSCEDTHSSKASTLLKAFSGKLAHRLKAKIEVSRDTSGFKVEIALPSAAHGALDGTSALSVAAQGLQNVGILTEDRKGLLAPQFYRYVKTPAIADFIKNLFSVYRLPSWLARALTAIPGLQQVALKELGKLVFSERLFRTSCSWTGFEIREGLGEALVDCRLLHTGFYSDKSTPQGIQFVEELRKRANDPRLNIELFKNWEYAQSSADSRNFDIIKSEILKGDPRAVVSSYLTPTGSDNAWFRAPISAGSLVAPIPSYGYFPAVLQEGLTGTIHGSNERLPLDQILPLVKIYSSTVQRLAND